MAYTSGQQIGNYKVVQQIGAGGFAEVYLGEHIHLETRAALKVLHARLADPQEIENFRKEARTIAQLQHPNIIRILDFQIQNNTPFFVMDFAPHGSLRDRHKRGEQVPFETVITYTNQAASALQFAHTHKYIHRDIKPENLLVGHQQEILVSDFGIAVVAQSTHMQTAQDMAGTVPYMAPEQIQAHPRPASDQYSLAITVYEWLTGRRPFDGTFPEMVVKQTSVPPPLPSQFVAISPATEQVILKALEKAPERRFPDISAFAAALDQSRQSSTIASAQNTTPEIEKTHQVLEPVNAPPLPKLVETTRSVHIEAPPPPVSWTPPDTSRVSPQPHQYTISAYPPYQYAQKNMTPYGFNGIYAHPPAPQQQALLPVLRGKPRRMDALWIGLYVVVGWILFACAAAYTLTSAVASAYPYQAGISLIGLLLWYFLSGCLLGSWRSLLALGAGSAVALFYLQVVVPHDNDFTISTFVSYGWLSLVGALIGCGYEWRKTQKKLHSFLIFALGIFLFFIITEISNSANAAATHISELFIGTCFSPIAALVPFLGELSIRGIVKLVSRFGQRKVAA